MRFFAPSLVFIALVILIVVVSGAVATKVYEGDPTRDAMLQNIATADLEIAELQSELDDAYKMLAELRWDMDDLLIKTRTAAETAEVAKLSSDHPESTVEVSEDYPKWRLPYGVFIDDQRPPDVLAADIEKAKAGKGIVYMWLSLPGSKPGRELRMYMTKIDYRKPEEAEPTAEVVEEK